jgi:hypothetical protein
MLDRLTYAATDMSIINQSINNIEYMADGRSVASKATRLMSEKQLDILWKE